MDARAFRLGRLIRDAGARIASIERVLEPLRPGEPVEVLYLTRDDECQTAYIHDGKPPEVQICAGW